MPTGADAKPVFMEKAPHIEWMRGNLFKITDESTGTIRITEAAVLAETIAAYAICYRAYRTSQSAQIIRFPGHAASS